MMSPVYRRILQFIIISDSVTVPSIAKRIDVSVPTALKLVHELEELNVIYNAGKVKGGEGRPANCYKICDRSILVLSVEILMKELRLALVDLNGNIYDYYSLDNFILRDDLATYNLIIDEITQYGERLLKSNDILGVAVSMTGRINIVKGKNQSFFSEREISLLDDISSRLNMPSHIANDTVSYALYEKIFGNLNGVDNAIYVNLSRGLGISIFSGRRLLTGTSGYAGEFGHIQRGKINRLCICGQRYCLGSEVSGYAVERDYAESLDYGMSSSDEERLTYDDIITKSKEGDKICKAIIVNLGYRLGEELASLVTTLNPEKIVISGTFHRVDDYFIRAVRRGVKRSSLTESYSDVSIDLLPWEPKYGLVGGAIAYFQNVDFM